MGLYTLADRERTGGAVRISAVDRVHNGAYRRAARNGDHTCRVKMRK